eukprot:354206-Chlamydomonas_euryale.AAC.4
MDAEILMSRRVAQACNQALQACKRISGLGLVHTGRPCGPHSPPCAGQYALACTTHTPSAHLCQWRQGCDRGRIVCRRLQARYGRSQSVYGLADGAKVGIQRSARDTAVLSAMQQATMRATHASQCVALHARASLYLPQRPLQQRGVQRSQQTLHVKILQHVPSNSRWAGSCGRRAAQILCEPRLILALLRSQRVQFSVDRRGTHGGGQWRRCRRCANLRGSGRSQLLGLFDTRLPGAREVPIGVWNCAIRHDADDRHRALAVPAGVANGGGSGDGILGVLDGLRRHVRRGRGAKQLGVRLAHRCCWPHTRHLHAMPMHGFERSPRRHGSDSSRVAIGVSGRAQAWWRCAEETVAASEKGGAVLFCLLHTAAVPMGVAVARRTAVPAVRSTARMPRP